jgi:hypothetical protein
MFNILCVDPSVLYESISTDKKKSRPMMIKSTENDLNVLSRIRFSLT